MKSAPCLLYCTGIASLIATVAALGKYDPCNPPGLATRAQELDSRIIMSCKSYFPAEPQGNGFYIGLAFWPNGMAGDWGPIYNATTGRFGLSPCNKSAYSSNTSNTKLTQQQYLASQGVAFGTFEIKVDALSALVIAYPDLQYIINGTGNTSVPYISAIAFRGAFRSDPVYIYSQQKATTQATGFVPSLSLIVQFNLGKLTYLKWSDMNCNTCGGQLSDNCMTTRFPQPQRSCTVSNCTSNSTCNLSVYGGFSGSDRNGRSFSTGLQLAQISQYSLSSYFYNGLAQLQVWKNTVGTTGTVGSTDSGDNGASGEPAK